VNKIYCAALGVATTNATGEIIEVFYPEIFLQPTDETSNVFAGLSLSGGTHILNEFQLSHLKSSDNLALASTLESLAGSVRPIILCILETDEAPTDVASAFLKLHLISHRLVKPHGTNIDGIFGKLKNLAWTREGAIELDELPARQLQARIEGRALSVDCVDKFPKMTDYLVPSGVRIADTARVRLGAYVGENTTVMHEGFINFNAGAEGPAMIEGRISAGVWIGANSDLGGGCSTMGTLSGGGNIRITVGENCLIGANAGTGIPLGDNCIVESGLYITAGTKVEVFNADGESEATISARELSGESNMLFRRNSLNGIVECRTNKTKVELNSILHQN